MNGAIKERRNRFGFPLLNSGDHSPITAKIQKFIDRSRNNNKPLPWVALGCFAGGIGFAMGLAAILVACIGGPAYIDARVEKLEAEIRAEFSQRLATQDATVEKSRQDSAIAKDWTDQKNAELKVYRGAR